MATNSEPKASSQAVVLYDGQCRFCIGQIANLRRLDLFHRLRFVSLHEASVAQDYPDLSHEQLMEQMWLRSHNITREQLNALLDGAKEGKNPDEIMAELGIKYDSRGHIMVKI